MSALANVPLGFFRKPEEPKPLHTRWGDATITVPTDGSWNQFDNPHQVRHRSQGYGPGYVPEVTPRTLRRVADDGDEESFYRMSNVKGGEPAIGDDVHRSQTQKRMSSYRRLSTIFPNSDSRRMSIRLAGKPKQQATHSVRQRSNGAHNKQPVVNDKPKINGCSNVDNDALSDEETLIDRQTVPDRRNTQSTSGELRGRSQVSYAYKSIQPDYATEIAPTKHRHSKQEQKPSDPEEKQSCSRFRYIPTSKEYLTKLNSLPIPRSQSVDSHRSEQSVVTLEDRMRALQLLSRPGSRQPQARRERSGYDGDLESSRRSEARSGNKTQVHHNSRSINTTTTTIPSTSDNRGPSVPRRQSSLSSSSSSSFTTDPSPPPVPPSSSRSARRTSLFFPLSRRDVEHNLDRQKSTRRKRSSSSRTLITRMVPDVEDIYG